MALGMGVDEFWDCSPERYRFYRDAHDLKSEQRNQELWMQGLYFLKALNVSLSHALSKDSTDRYFEQPLPLKVSEEERREKEEQQKAIAQEKLINYLNSFKEDWERKNGRSSSAEVSNGSCR